MAYCVSHTCRHLLVVQFFLADAAFVVPRTISGKGFVQSSKPIMLAKFMTSDVNAPSGEPTMTVIPPVQQYLSDYDFNVSTSVTAASA